MKSLSISMLLLVASMFSQQQPTPTAPSPVFRDPFTLKLRVDREQYYYQHFDKIPYVVENDVYLFAGDAFGIKLEIENNQISGLAYEPDVTKADVWFIFSQEKDLQSGKGMMLVIQNRMKHTLLLDALMTVPQSKAIQKTSIVPIAAGLSDYEEWPHPIVQLVLKNARFEK